jgi:hypothetical protein
MEGFKMSAADEKPGFREWWICNNNPLDTCKDAHVYEDKPLWSKDPIHVVDYLFYESVDADCDEAVESLLELRRENAALQAQVKTLTEALEQVAHCSPSVDGYSISDLKEIASEALKGIK